MKKSIFLIILTFIANYVIAQKLNRDTLDKYSKKSEQVKIFNRIAADIHLNSVQGIKFSELCSIYSDKAIGAIKEPGLSPCDKVALLKQILKEYSIRVKQVLSPSQFAMLKEEREKYRFGRRFITFTE